MRIFGQHDENTIRQLQDVASRAERVALMADGHVGYVMPIGGVAAYRNQVSVVGVGFDIACLAAGTPVTTRDGYHLPIERVAPEHPVLCWDGERVRPVVPHVGAVARGRRAVLRLTLSNGRSVRATADHEILTHAGWRPAGSLRPGDAVACPVFVGLPHVADEREIPVVLPGPRAERELASRGLYPLRADDPRLPAVLRLLGYVSGDGHLSRDGKRVSIYVFDEADAEGIVEDFRRIGFEPRIHRRTRREGYREEIHVYVGSRSLHALFAALGSPVGKKDWSESPMPWLLNLPAWLRAQYVSAFCSAEMMTPRVHANGAIPNLQLKQAGNHLHGITFVAELLRSLGYSVSVAPSGVQRGSRITSVLQILGGREEQLRFLEEVGFCYSRGKREAAAVAASVAWQGISFVRNRDRAKEEARRLKGEGVGWRTVLGDVSVRFGVSQGFVYHSIYDERGSSRRLPGEAVSSDATGEVCWVAVDRVDEDGEAPVYDVVTGDPAHCFLAAGLVVHNCGNAAIRTDTTVEQLAGMTLAEARSNPHRFAQNRRMRELADQIAAEVSFGIGRKNRSDDAPVDDPLFLDAAWYVIPNKGSYRDDLREKARKQLGTVGSGNHYVDVFADETGTVWVGVHFGSRGFGHTVASGFLALGQGRDWGERVPEREVLLELDAPVGHDYWHLMELAGRYAYAGREWVARKVVGILGAREVELVHNHHNFAWREEHGGQEYVVVRKGATPAFPGQKGFIGGSMGDDAVIVRGTMAGEGSEAARVQREALFSTVHGAGRVMSRTAAAGKRHRRTGRVITPGKVSPEMMKEWLRDRGVVLRGGGLDESPHVYRRLPKVLAAQGETVEVLHTLRPLIVVMAGADEFDPYKD
ncbi:MAG TPA: RtcB family protein [Longimicrobiaceae bacterium]|nr:RtcB family protein [Longimicrobiaceae bacterium]